MNVNIDINDTTIAGDHNQSVIENEIKKIIDEIGVKEIHPYVNNVRVKELDKSCENGSSLLILCQPQVA